VPALRASVSRVEDLHRDLSVPELVPRRMAQRATAMERASHGCRIFNAIEAALKLRFERHSCLPQNSRLGDKWLLEAVSREGNIQKDQPHSLIGFRPIQPMLVDQAG